MANPKVVEVGKPHGFSSAVDPNDTVSDYIKNKMSVIDIIPCTYELVPAQKLSGLQAFKMTEALSYTIDYSKGMTEYAKLVSKYLGTSAHLVRIYSTDETTASDEIANTYSSNFIADFVNSLGSLARRTGISPGTTEKLTGKIREMVKNGVSSIGGVENFKDLINTTVNSVVNFGLKGEKISLPMVWDSSDYRPILQAILRLVSPYGHPDAIKKYLVEPLTYLLLLSAPRSYNNLTYGNFGHCVSIMAYGVSEIQLGAISSLTIRRGGGDTAFNIYKQPIVLDITLTFQNILSGFAKIEGDNAKKVYFGLKSEFNAYSPNVNQSPPTGRPEVAVPSVGNIISSLSPISINLPKQMIKYQPSVTSKSAKLVSSVSTPPAPQIYQKDITTVKQSTEKIQRIVSAKSEINVTDIGTV